MFYIWNDLIPKDYFWWPLSKGKKSDSKKIDMSLLILMKVCINFKNLNRNIQNLDICFFLCSACSVKMRGDCSFCWYWWNRWPSLFKLSFHKQFACCSQQTPTIFYLHLILEYLFCLHPLNAFGTNLFIK